MALEGPRATTELDATVALIQQEQARPERRCAYVGTDADGIRAELEATSPPWSETVRVVTDDGAVVGASIVHWDEALGRCWVLGPWVAGDAATWDAAAPALLDAALAQLPATVTKREASGDVANELLADLTAERGWLPGVVNHVLVADAAAVATWPDDETTVPIRDGRPEDLQAIAELHDLEFPGTYASAGQLLGHNVATRIVLVVPAVDGGPSALAGYAAGQVHADGEGFVDFVAVHPAARRTGVGHRLVTAITRELLAASTTGRVALVVQEPRAEARSLYERLGFHAVESLRAYRSWSDR